MFQISLYSTHENNSHTTHTKGVRVQQLAGPG